MSKRRKADRSASSFRGYGILLTVIGIAGLIAGTESIREGDATGWTGVIAGSLLLPAGIYFLIRSSHRPRSRRSPSRRRPSPRAPASRQANGKDDVAATGRQGEIDPWSGQPMTTATGTSAFEPSLPVGHLSPPPRGRAIEPWITRGERVEVSGEAARAAVFERIFGDDPGYREPDGAQRELEAALVADPSNPEDGDAVAVWVEDLHAGFLPLTAARAWKSVLADLAVRGEHLVVPAKVRARRTERGRINARVSLTLPQAGHAFPCNELPGEPSLVLPGGGRVQVTQEAEHQEVLAPLARADGVPVALTLHLVTEHRPRSVQERIEVRLDGERIGVLSATQSANLAALVGFASQRGRVAVARGLVTGAVTARASVVLDAKKANDVDQAWFVAHDGEAPVADEADTSDGSRDGRPGWGL